ncbi:DUF5995 family protein (plasmid) [Deinococcus taeanensis]|uniref:DUF5995 family protein n=1 Tax=Deinococcus taeanensis TaxID=2737050 RepID=UPI001CDD87CE|nr:DUF5995 family protein [Deinococcus taeanensis]UBV44120.1 DUF5995 family protein [Deinococcus taeanensis]
MKPPSAFNPESRPTLTEEGVTGALARLGDLERQYRSQRDPRAVFAGAYVVITSAMHQALGAQLFLDPPWVERYLAAFAGLYLDAAQQYDAGPQADDDLVPPVWRLTFATCREETVSPLTHLLLGVNAHVNRDLAVALVRAGVRDHTDRRYEDHKRVNDVLRGAVNDLQASVTADAPVLARLDTLCGPWDEHVACTVVAWARETAWAHAVHLAGAEGETYARHLDRIERRAYRYALLIKGHPAVWAGPSGTKG